MDRGQEWVSQEFENLAHVLNDYDPNLFLEMVPVAEWENLVDKTKIFRVVDTRLNKVVLYASAISSPQEILGRVWSMDQDKNDVVANLDAQNRAAQALQMRKHMDELEEQKDLVLFIARNTKSRWKHNGRMRNEHFQDLGPAKTHLT